MKDITVILCCLQPNHLATLLPGIVALNAINTTIVLPRTQEIQRTKVIPKAVWRSIQDQSEGRPMKVREHRKHRVKEKSSRKLSSELLAFTTGVNLCLNNTMAVMMVKQAPTIENAAKIIPKISLKERNSTSLGRQKFFSALGQDSLGHGEQSDESGERCIVCFYCYFLIHNFI